jgi:uncharacterized membrane protein YhhN
MNKSFFNLYLLAFIAGYGYVISVTFKPYDFSYLVKATPVLILALIAYLQIRSAEKQLSSKYGYVFILAMLGSASGDIFLDLDRALYLKQALGSFLITQAAYIYLFYPRTIAFNSEGFKSAGSKVLLIPLLMIFTGFLLTQFYITAGSLFIPVLVYCLLLLTMACMALLVVNNPWINIGGLLFLKADALIGINRFIFAFDYSTNVIVTLYITAQLMIAWGLLFHSQGSVKRLNHSS